VIYWIYGQKAGGKSKEEKTVGKQERYRGVLEKMGFAQLVFDSIRRQLSEEVIRHTLSLVLHDNFSPLVPLGGYPSPLFSCFFSPVFL
jgi:hypothetical protein